MQGRGFQKAIRIQNDEGVTLFARKRRSSLHAKINASPTGKSCRDQDAIGRPTVRLHVPHNGTGKIGSDDYGHAHDEENDEARVHWSSFYRLPARRSAWRCCKAWTRTSPRCSAAMPSAAARAAESVVMVGIRAVTAARRMAFSSNQGSAPVGVFTMS